MTKLLATTAVLSALFPVVSTAATVVTPYANTFTTDTTGDFTTSGTYATWSWDGTNQSFHNTISLSNTNGQPANGSPAQASVGTSNPLLASQGFIMSTTFILNADTSGAPRIGFGALGTNTTLSAGTVLADVNVSGTLRFASLGAGSVSSGTDTWGSSLVIGREYILTLTGTRNGDATDFVFSLSGLNDADIQQTKSVSATFSTAPTGTNFGYRTSTASNSQLDVNFDNFSLDVIPEPSSVALLGVSLAAMILRRRR